MTKLAIITGAGQGIGAAIAKRLAKEQYAVAIADIDSDKAANVANAINASTGVAKSYQVDVANREAVFNLVEQATNDLGQLAVFVNNAGIAFIDNFVSASAADVRRLIDVNLLGTYWGIQAAAITFKKQGQGGRIVNAASLAGYEASALQSAYSASKFGVRGLTQAAAKELASDNITVNAYNPGIVRTKMRDAIDEQTARLKNKTVKQQQADCLAEIALGREATPADVADVVSWFVSDQAKYITGQSLQVDEGMRYH